MTEKTAGDAGAAEGADRAHVQAFGPEALGELAGKLREARGSLSPAERRVLDYIMAHPADGLFLSAVELARLSGTSDATVIRAAKNLGFAGLPEFKHELGIQLMVTMHPARRLATRITSARGLSAKPMIERIVDEVADRLQETRRRFDEAQFERAVALLADAGTVYSFGVGVSKVAAEYLAMRLNRLGVSSHFSGQMGFGLADELLRLRKGDSFVIFAPGRLVREVEVIIERAAQVGASIVTITDHLSYELDEGVTVSLSAPLSAGGLTGEVLSASVMSDALLLAIAERNAEQATEVSETLTQLRRDLSARSRR